MANPVTLIDIPVKRLERAMRFYAAVLDLELTKEEFPTLAVGRVPHEDTEVAVCLFPSSPAADSNQPAERGPLIYLNCEGRLAEALEAVEQNGGMIVSGRHSLGASGWRAIVLDSEGNRIGLHSHES